MKLFTLMQVKGHGNEHYLVFPRHFCSCQSFHYDVLSKSEAICVGVPGQLHAYLLNVSVCKSNI